MVTRIAIALGSNLGDRLALLREAQARLARELVILAASSVYETEPAGLREQPPFLNAALLATTTRTPRAVLDLLLGTEKSLGRVRDRPLGPRLIDLDLLLYDDLKLAEPGLTLPHPRLNERLFVLTPLSEIYPNYIDPISGLGIAELRAKARAGPVLRRIGPLA